MNIRISLEFLERDPGKYRFFNDIINAGTDPYAYEGFGICFAIMYLGNDSGNITQDVAVTS
ncbi:hypothetical protein [Pedobacter psychrodurus]|uniref:hypothetical protein n=1 Tax=Pedobacter psychrodurus TaxID=2530456 RepID=UPI002930A665|nr:hypothetical protein [Pedobacter psychrodurus]